MMEKNMYDSLVSIKNKYEELQIKINDNKVLADIKKYTIVIKEINNIKPIFDVFCQYLIFEKNLKDAKDILKQENDKDILEIAKMEIQDSEENMPKLIDKLKILLLPVDQNDDKNVIVEIRGAAGGDEANIFAGDLYRMYTKWADQNIMKTKLLDSNYSESGGFSIVVFSISGEKVFSKLKFENGAHRVQRIPKTETQGRVHTSTATVTVMPEIEDDFDIEINPSDLQIDTYRSSGAGGQSVNTTDSAVRITHKPSGIVSSSQDGRSQIENKALALKVLKSRIYDAELRKQQEKKGALRKLAGTGARSEKVRTYNYPQDRVTDHRIGFSTSLKNVMEGKMNVIVEALLAAEQAEKIQEAGI